MILANPTLGWIVALVALIVVFGTARACARPIAAGDSVYPALHVASGPRLQLSISPASGLISVAPRAPDAALRDLERRSLPPAWLALVAALGLTSASALNANLDRRIVRELDRHPVRPSEADAVRGRWKRFAAISEGFGASTILMIGAAVYRLSDPSRAIEARAAGGLRASILPSLSGLSIRGCF